MTPPSDGDQPSEVARTSYEGQLERFMVQPPTPSVEQPLKKLRQLGEQFTYLEQTGQVDEQFLGPARSLTEDVKGQLERFMVQPPTPSVEQPLKKLRQLGEQFTKAQLDASVVRPPVPQESRVVPSPGPVAADALSTAASSRRPSGRARIVVTTPEDRRRARELSAKAAAKVASLKGLVSPGSGATRGEVP